QRAPADRLLVSTQPRKGDRVNAIQPAKALLIAAVIGLGLSGGLAAAAFLPGGSAPAAVSPIWDQTVGQMFGNGLGEKGSYITAAATYKGIGARPNPANGYGPGPGFGRGPGDRNLIGDSDAA